MNKEYQKRREKGLCCSCSKAAAPGHVHCEEHLILARERSRNKRANPATRSAELDRCRDYHRKLRQQILEKYGVACIRCGYSDERALQLDHVNGGGRQERKRLRLDGVYRKALADNTGQYQILCANCNSIKRHEENIIGADSIGLPSSRVNKETSNNWPWDSPC